MCLPDDCLKTEDGTYLKSDCVAKLPQSFSDKRVGRSKYYYEDYRDSQCLEIATKKEPVSFIDNDYLDG